MKTYQDLIKVGESDADRGQFCREAVNMFMGSEEYRLAKAGQAYYDKHNLTIEAYKKFLYTLSGNKIEDVFGANYKLETNVFRRLCLQQNMYVLGNGVTLIGSDNAEVDKSLLGKDFDFQLQKIGKVAMAQGVAFGFWNLDHLEVFGYADTPKMAGFCPLFDEDTSELKAGIRFWFRTVGSTRIFRATLYEIDGYTEYSQKNSEDVIVLKDKRPYIINTVSTEAGGVEEIWGDMYDGFPIKACYASDTQTSELSEGLRNKIDAYDLIESGLANTIDDTSGFFWLVKNAGGMDDTDLARFVQRVKTVKAASVDSEEGGAIEPVTYDVPIEARRYILEQLRKDIYEDFGALDINTLSAAAKTTQEIQAAYQNQDNKCADFEYYITDFVQQILDIAGIDATPTFTWNKVVNMSEQTNMILSCAQYLPEDIVIKKLPFLTPEEAEQAINQNDVDSFNQFNNAVNDTNTEPQGNEEDNE